MGQLMVGVGTLHRSNPDIHIPVAEEMDLGTLAVAVEVESPAAEDTLVGTLVGDDAHVEHGYVGNSLFFCLIR